MKKRYVRANQPSFKYSKTQNETKRIHLRYYATFKMRKLESLFYKRFTFLKKKITTISIETIDCGQMTKSYIFKNLNLGRKAEHGFCSNL